jgi:transcriptional regulator with XRE-family HTH domain
MARDCRSAGNSAGLTLWHQLGARLRERRRQVGLKEGAIAAHLGISVQRYKQFEAGEDRMSAALLAQACDLLQVPLFYFFQDLQFGADNLELEQSEPAPRFAVATPDERLAALTEDFQRVDREGQNYLLLLARALAHDTDAK